MSALTQEIIAKVELLDVDERQHVLRALERLNGERDERTNWRDWAETFSRNLRREQRLETANYLG